MKNLAELRELTLVLEALNHLKYTPCPNCGDKLVPGYTSKTTEEFLQCERPDFWFCDHCRLEYKETKTGNLERSQRHCKETKEWWERQRMRSNNGRP